MHAGQQKGIKTIVKLPVRDMIDIYKGEKKLIILGLYEKGFFGKYTMIGEAGLATSFIRSNVLE